MTKSAGSPLLLNNMDGQFPTATPINRADCVVKLRVCRMGYLINQEHASQRYRPSCWLSALASFVVVNR